MIISKIMKFPKIIVLILIFYTPFNVYASRVEFSGPLLTNEVDLSGGLLSGTEIGTLISGSFNFDEIFGINEIEVENNLIALSGLPISPLGGNDNVEVTPEEATLVNRFFGERLIIPGQVFDRFTRSGFVGGAIGTNESIFLFQTIYFLDSDTFENNPIGSQLRFQEEDIIAAGFLIYEGLPPFSDDSGNDDALIESATYLAGGPILETTFVPLPASAWFLLTGLIAYARLVVYARLKSRKKTS